MEKRIYILLGLAVGALALLVFSRTQRGSVVVSDLADSVTNLFMNRGLRNNNPGNIRRTSDVWVGQLSRETVEANGGTWDADFVQFDTIDHGIRALGHILKTYAHSGLNTVNQIIARWAPPTENDTASYSSDVSDELQVAGDSQIDVFSALPNVAAAIMRRETGYTADLDFITQAVNS